MRLTNKKALEKLKRKNIGNKHLVNSIGKLIHEIEDNNWKTPIELSKFRTDANCVHSDGFYFFNITVYRSMILIEFEEGEASVVWVGTHQDYEKVFKNNKNTIKAWLKSNNWI